MSIKELFSTELTSFDIKSENKQAAIDELTELLAESGKINDIKEFRSAVQQREDQFSTGIGMGIAIPHGRGSMVKETCIAYGKSKNGIDFDSIDGEPVKMIFLLAVPEDESEVHLKSVAEIARKLMHNDIREKLFEAQNYSEFLSIW